MTYEFDVVVRVRKRIWASGFVDREQARDIMKRSLQGGMNINTLAKRGNDGYPIEVIIDNDFDLTDPTVEVV